MVGSGWIDGLVRPLKRLRGIVNQGDESVRIKPSFFLPDFSTDVPVVWRLGSRLGFWDKSLNYPLEERLRPYTGSSLWPLATMPVLGGPVLGGPDG